MATTQTRRVLSASTLSSNNVRNLADEKLGSIEDLMIDTETGHIAYAVLSVGGFLGMGDKLFAIPWGALQLDDEEECFLLDADKERLENAPGFDKDDWPEFADRTWGAEIHRYYGSRPYWT